MDRADESSTWATTDGSVEKGGRAAGRLVCCWEEGGFALLREANRSRDAWNEPKLTMGTSASASSVAQFQNSLVGFHALNDPESRGWRA